MLELIRTTKGDDEIKRLMSVHYSQPKGFVGRQLIYKILVNGISYGAIAAGSATLHLPGRKEFFGKDFQLNWIVNNVFFHIEKVSGSYPCRNFAQKIVKSWREKVKEDWPKQYSGDPVVGFETLVELPRKGELYLRDGWSVIGQTAGWTCKRVAGDGGEKWGGKRVWSSEATRPKLVLARLASEGMSDVAPA